MGDTQDTSADALEAQRKVFRRMTGSQRFAMASRMSDEARSLARDGARHRERGSAEPDSPVSVSSRGSPAGGTL